MLYRDYKQRLEKYKNAIDWVWRFRIPLLLAFGLLVTLISVLVGITGNVSGIECPATIDYGTDYNIEGKAVFRKATVEYRKQGASDWSEEKPIRIGAYEVRAVSTSATGKKKIGKSSSFTLVPKQLEVSASGSSFVYGELPEVAAALAYRDRFTESHLSFEWKTWKVCRVTPSVGNIVDENGVDVTECYTVLLTAKNMNVIPRPISLRTESATKVYDGTPLKAEGYSLVEGTLLDGETLQVDFPVQTDAAERKNIPECTVFDKNGKDITVCYDVSVQAGTLNVLPREIMVRTGSKTWIHDGNPHSFWDRGTYAIEGLLEGHYGTVVQATSVTDVTDTDKEVGYRNNELDIFIRDENGKDVTRNYAFSYEYGHLRIKTRIYITVYCIQKTYDGTPLRFERGDYHVVKPPDVTVSLDLSGLSLTEAGYLPLSAAYGIPIRVEDIATGMDVRGENLLEFTGEADEPILKIEKRKIEVRSISITEVPGYSPLYGWKTERPAWISLGSLADGHSIEIEVTGILNVYEATAENTISSVKIFDASHRDVTQNYAISLSPGELRWK